MSEPTLVNFEVLCAICCTAKTMVPRVLTRTNHEGANLQACLPALESQGWAVKRNDRLNRHAVCPGCLESQRRAAAANPLSEYRAEAICPKCGATGLGKRYCSGRTPECRQDEPREHLHRLCGQCGYDFIHRCQDARERPRARMPNEIAAAGFYERTAS